MKESNKSFHFTNVMLWYRNGIFVLRNITERAVEMQKDVYGNADKDGYKDWSIEKALHPSKRQSKDPQSQSTTPQPRGVGVSVPYLQGMSEKIQMILSS